jgi:DNA helicase-2/ATP-dependent DNA helicase PcrA
MQTTTNKTHEQFLILRNKIIECEFSKMNSSQKEAVFATQGPLLILAGAGSGKTTVLVNRISCILKYGHAYNSDYVPFDIDELDIQRIEECLSNNDLIDDNMKHLLSVEPAPAWSILAITFTNKAANELKERLSAMLGADANEIWACTFHSACSRILRRDIERLDMGYNHSFTIYDMDDSLKVLRECTKEIIDDKNLTVKSVYSAICKAKEGCLDPVAYERTIGSDFRLKKISQAYYKYQESLRQANALDFDDMIFLAVKLFETNPDILEYYQRRFKYIMVDEYQDTNKLQYKLVSMLADLHKNICVVGDDDQSIYSFRGATIENIMSFEHQFMNAKVIKLEQNYRSTCCILDAANTVIANNTERKGKNLWTNNVKGEKISVCRFDDELCESQFIANTILENVKNGRKFCNHAILYRMNAQSSSIEKAFVRSGIPYRIIGGHRFYERLEIKDMLAYLSVINNPRDNVRFRRIVNTPKRSIGNATVEAAEQIADANNLSLYDAFLNSDDYENLAKKTPRIRDFMIFMEEMRVIKDTAQLHDLFAQVMEKSGYIAALRLDNSKEALERIENLNTLISSAIDYEKENDEPTLQGYLEETALMTDIDNYEEGADTVVLMTLHSAKGLEFPVVFIVGLEEGIFPSQNSMYFPKDLEEERRLAYVGITRAKEKLYLTYANVRMLFGSTVYNRPSRFIEEIPEELREHNQRQQSYIQKKSNKAVATESKMPGTQRIGISQSKPNACIYNVGEIVNHDTFGKGLIITRKSMGNDQLLEISFDNFGTKKIMAAYAKMSKSEE